MFLDIQFLWHNRVWYPATSAVMTSLYQHMFSAIDSLENYLWKKQIIASKDLVNYLTNVVLTEDKEFILIVYFKTNNVWQWECFGVSHYKSHLGNAVFELWRPNDQQRWTDAQHLVNWWKTHLHWNTGANQHVSHTFSHP